MVNPIHQIQELGQSLWYDNIRRGLLESGELAQLIAKGITGVTSNPTIFEKAIDGSHDYDAAIEKLAPTVQSIDALYDALVLDDIARGADLLRPIYENTKGKDGYISIEVPPTLAEDTDATVKEAHRLFQALNRPNVMIKVPATKEGIPAIRQLIQDGINVNVTLIFSLEAYSAVIDAYIAGLKDRQMRGLPLDRVASVASFFVSRVDTLVDRLIEERGVDETLKGKAAIANAKLAYELFLQRFNGPDFSPLKAAGAMVQRPLWASTSTKNPAYPDLLYVEALMGPDTVDTLPPTTVDAILDHGQASRTIDQGIDEARQAIDALENAGISMNQVTAQLLEDGVKSFHKSFVALRESLEKKSTAHRVSDGIYYLGSFENVVREAADQLNHDRAVPRLWEHDPTLWSDDPQHQALIKNALGWLNVPAQVLEDVHRMHMFFNQLLLEGFQDAVVLGMGGSSLVSDVLVHTFPVGKPGLTLHVLDTTDPRAIDHLTHRLALAHTLFIVASKSGTTTEPNAFYHYFWHLLERQGLNPAPQFIAITDPGTRMAKEAAAKGFRQVFLNPADIGGRYSALSWFGMVPATLYGLDVRRLLSEAMTMKTASETPDASQNPAARLGATLGALAKAGRDKVTLIMPEAISHLGDWLEQLLAESTGKLGTGLVPIAHEPEQDIHAYSHDRVFVVYQWGDQAPRQDPKALAAAGHPVIHYRIADPYQVAQEFYRWEVATAIAGAVLHIDAFDQPNVQESKDNTKAILGALNKGKLPPETREEGPNGIQWTASKAIKQETLKGTLKALYDLAGSSSYIAIMAYIEPTHQADQALAELRRQLTEATGRPTTLGYGPRFLHSTGQLHKGGPATGLFVQIVAQDGPHLEVSGDGYDFLTLMQAQALGDFQSLESHGRPVVRILAPNPASTVIETLSGWLG